MLEKEASRCKEHLIRIPRRRPIEQRVARIEGCALRRVVRRIQFNELVHRRVCQGAVVNNEMADEIDKGSGFCCARKSQAADTRAEGRAFVHLRI